MNSPPTERSPPTDTTFLTTHEDRIFWLDQAWKGSWLPEDAGVRWEGTDDALAYYMVKITHVALDRGIRLTSLWDAESPHGYLRRAVTKDSEPHPLTPDIINEVYESIMASESSAPNDTSSEHSSDKSDDEDSVDLPDAPQAQETTTAQFQPLPKTEHEFRSKLPNEHQDGPSTKPPHTRHEDQHSPLSRPSRRATDAAFSATGQKLTAEVIAITGIATQEDPIEKNALLQPAFPALMGSPDLSTRPGVRASPDGLLQPHSSSMQPPEHSLFPFVSSPLADEPQNRVPSPNSPATPHRKRKRDMTSVTSTPAYSVISERLSGPLSVEKIVRQLTCDVQLTDDIVELICQAIVVEHGGDNVRMLSPLWFEADELSTLPQSIRGLDQEQTICFPIHHKLSKHWTMGIARVHLNQVVLTFHDSIRCSERANAVRRRFQAWMEKVKLKQPLIFQTKECTQQEDGVSCGVHAAVCLRRDLRGETCCDPIEPWSEKRAMLETLGSVRETSPIHSTVFPLLRELRNRQSLGADPSIVSTPRRGGSAVPITVPEESEVQIIQPPMGIGYLLDGLSLETLQGRFKDAETRLNEAINARDNAQETLRDLGINQRLIHDMYPRIIRYVQSCGISMDEHSDATMAVQRNMKPEGLNQGQISQHRQNIMGDFLRASEREGVERALAAIREYQARVFADIGNAQQMLNQRNEEITSIGGEVASLQEICEAKKTLEKYSGSDWLAYFQSL
ncbi:hypothetical protein N0V84_008780 [Fusarium piperis]|uniref:Uncharacterized protein n=1 Tax=Fusarium piperis TaxID=1435070 RepID=A0A9W9BJC0_9HYPO|nr:hypothetical protein N0V84_008780 [Fusarium piperis]